MRQLTIPIGTVYDPFVCRGLDALIYALYSGAKFIFAGTRLALPSPEGGAHQSTINAVDLALSCRQKMNFAPE